MVLERFLMGQYSPLGRPQSKAVMAKSSHPGGVDGMVAALPQIHGSIPLHPVQEWKRGQSLVKVRPESCPGPQDQW